MATSRRCCGGLVFALVVLLLANVPDAPAQSGSSSGIRAVTTRSALQGTDYIDWSILGDQGSIRSLPSTVKTHRGDSVQLLTPRNIQRVLQGDSWKGGFAPGDALINTAPFATAPLTIKFEVPVGGVGTQIEGWQVGSFDAELKVFDSAGQLLGSVKTSGTQYGPKEYPQHERSAPFLGVLSGRRNIQKVEIDTLTSWAFMQIGHLFLINRVDIVAAPSPEDVEKTP